MVRRRAAASGPGVTSVAATVGSTSVTVHQSGRYRRAKTFHSGYVTSPRARASRSSVSSARVLDAAAPLATLPPCLVRWVAASAPGLPLPFDRELPSSRWSRRPTAPLPPTGLNRSNPRVGLGVLAVVELLQDLSRGLAGDVPGLLVLWRARLVGPDMAWVDGAEERRRILDRLLAPRDGEGVGRRRRSIRHRRIDQGPDRRWDEAAAARGAPGGPRRRGTAGVTRPRRSRLPRISGARLPAADQRRLDRDDPQLVDRTKGVVDEHDRAVGPRTLTGPGGRHRQRACRRWPSPGAPTGSGRPSSRTETRDSQAADQS